MRMAIDRSGQKIVFSTSPGATAVIQGDQVRTPAAESVEASALDAGGVPLQA
jgi:hypothetical protein